MNKDTMIKLLEEVINIPSCVGYYRELTPYMKSLCESYGLTFFEDEKNTCYMKMEGCNHDKTVCVGAHLDTLGMVVRCIQSNGWLKVKPLGGLNYASLEGSYVTIITRDGRKYNATLHCKSHSVHVYDDAHTLARDENSIVAIIDEDVKCKEDVLALGIMNGDVICFDPKFTVLDNGYIKSRFLDDKASVAIILATIEHLIKTNQKPLYDTIFAFPYYEEIGHGGAVLPSEVSEYVAIDIGLIGEELDGDEKKVTICAKDNYTPYDYNLTSELIDLAKTNDIDFAVDVFHRYGSDASAAIRAGNNIKAACIGMGCLASHSVERTHIKGMEETAKLLLAYLLKRCN